MEVALANAVPLTIIVGGDLWRKEREATENILVASALNEFSVYTSSS